MWQIPTRLIVLAALTVTGARFSHAELAAAHYPYCSVSNSTGALNCYVRSRAECGSSCIDNPYYTGPAAQARAYPRARGLRHR